MKTLLILITIAISCLVTSCCKGPYAVAGVMVDYPDLTNPETIKAIRTDRNNLSAIIDTLYFGELNSTNNYSALIDFEDGTSNYIIYVENTAYIDTITEIVVERKACSDKIKTFQYKLNGQIRTDNKLTIR